MSAAVGTTLSVVLGKPTTYDLEAATGFPSLTYTKIGTLGQIGDVGGSHEQLTFTLLETGIIEKSMGPTDYGTLNLQYKRDPDDAGYLVLKAGFDGVNRDAEHSYMITFPDASKMYFTGKVASAVTNIGSASNILLGTTDIAVTGKVIED